MDFTVVIYIVRIGIASMRSVLDIVSLLGKGVKHSVDKEVQDAPIFGGHDEVFWGVLIPESLCMNQSE